VHFVVKLNIKTLVAQLNRSALDFLRALTTRWLAWIRLFDFDVRYVSRKKNAVADRLSKISERLLKKDRDDEDIEDFINGELDFIKVSLIIVYPTPIKARVYLFLAFKGEESNEKNKQTDTGSKNKESLKDSEEGVAEESEKE
jgi:hypothetical protein